MPTLTPEQRQALLDTYASGIAEIDVPGGQRIKYADLATLRKILADADAASGGTSEVSGARTFARFCRDL